MKKPLGGSALGTGTWEHMEVSPTSVQVSCPPSPAWSWPWDWTTRLAEKPCLAEDVELSVRMCLQPPDPG